MWGKTADVDEIIAKLEADQCTQGLVSPLDVALSARLLAFEE
jgi:hypothetical protein